MVRITSPGFLAAVVLSRVTKPEPEDADSEQRADESRRRNNEVHCVLVGCEHRVGQGLRLPPKIPRIRLSIRDRTLPRTDP
jgi:hypothetical protein